jgi:hypothetical protein
MSRKQRAPKYTVWSAVDTTTSPTSTETGVKQLDSILYEITIGASVNATLEVEGSTDADNAPAKTFGALDFGQALTLLGSTDTSYQVLIRDNTFNFLRLKLTNNGGTGNITAHVSGVSKGA